MHRLDNFIQFNKYRYNINGKDSDLLELEPDERSKNGIFLGFQYPIEIPGVTNFNFLMESFNEVSKAQGAGQMDEKSFREFIMPKLELLEMREEFLEDISSLDYF